MRPQGQAALLVQHEDRNDATDVGMATPNAGRFPSCTVAIFHGG
jgi:hypothetical protein